MKQISNFLFSIKTTLVLLLILGVGAAVATFLENDYGTSTARVLVYYSWWYELVMLFAGVNLAGVIYRYKMWRNPPRFIFHTAFLVILIGAAISHFYGREGVIHIREGYIEDRMLTTQPYLQVTIQDSNRTYYQEFAHDFSAIGNNNFTDTLIFDGQKLTVQYMNYKFTKKGRTGSGILRVKVCYHEVCKEVDLIGQRGAKGFAKEVNISPLKIKTEYGSKVTKLPFSLQLRDFQLDRYPGSMAPSSYASEVTVVDGRQKFDYRIFMNHTLTYRGHTFYQSSYDQDEKGTILSINDDPGKWPTYIGYLLLAMGLLWNLFDRSSRFGKLIRFIRGAAPVWSILIFIGIAALPAQAAEISDFEMYLDKYSHSSSRTAHLFGRLITQSPMGRMEPVDSLNTQLLYKIHGGISFRGLDQDQVLMGMLSRPELWRYAKLIKIKSPRLKEVLGIERSAKYAAFADAFADQNRYKLKEYVEQANRTNPNKRGTFEREVISMDEKLNVIYMTFYGNLFRIYPLPNDPSRSWYNPLEAMQKFGGSYQQSARSMTHTFIDAVSEGRWKDAQKAIHDIAAYQSRYGADLLPEPAKVKAELFYNMMRLFPRLVGIYMLLGAVLLVVGFIQIVQQTQKPLFVWIRNLSIVSLVLLFIFHTAGLVLRWYISGHAPWSDAYESLLYISWSAMLAGLLFFRKSILVLAATVIVAGIFMFTAHLSNINPQITNLVPVLKSYWLTIHVSVITASYGFLGLGAVLGYIVLLLFILRDPHRRPHIDVAIYRLTAVNEAALIIGLSMLTVGNFIGGVWANESWGRYWGWDPKETWAYVSIVVYAIVLHLRLIPRLDRPFVFSTASFLAFSTILMTYFGVNFYLSGMHSYATGDPVPIPVWVYYLAAMAIVTIAAAWFKRNLRRIKLRSGS
jgi:cytochrome c-type biogenesis protein CcsB